jgi:hypothetical protein
MQPTWKQGDSKIPNFERINSFGARTLDLIYSSAAAPNEFLTVPHEPRCRDLFEISPLFVGLCVSHRIQWKYVYRESLPCGL